MSNFDLAAFAAADPSPSNSAPPDFIFKHNRAPSYLLSPETTPPVLSPAEATEVVDKDFKRRLQYSIELHGLPIPPGLAFTVVAAIIGNGNILFTSSGLDWEDVPGGESCVGSLLSKIVPLVVGLNASFVTCDANTTPEDFANAIVPPDIFSGFERYASSSSQNPTGFVTSQLGGWSGGNWSNEDTRASTVTRLTAPSSRVTSQAWRQNMRRDREEARRIMLQRLRNVIVLENIDLASPVILRTVLEVLSAKKVVSNGTVYDLPQPFSLMATISPNGDIATLSERLRDEFMFSVSLPESLPPGIPAIPINFQSIYSPSELEEMSLQLDDVFITQDLEQFIRDIIVELRNSPNATSCLSPRATKAHVCTSKAMALLNGRSFTTPTDALSVAGDVLAHRLQLHPDIHVLPRVLVADTLAMIVPPI